MRPLPYVIEAMLNVLQDDKYKTVKQRLKSVQDSSMCAAPEAQSLWWNQTAEVLNQELGQLDMCEELDTVSKIFGAKLDYTNFLNKKA